MTNGEEKSLAVLRRNRWPALDWNECLGIKRTMWLGFGWNTRPTFDWRQRRISAEYAMAKGLAAKIVPRLVKFSLLPDLIEVLKNQDVPH